MTPALNAYIESWLNKAEHDLLDIVVKNSW